MKTIESFYDYWYELDNEDFRLPQSKEKLEKILKEVWDIAYNLGEEKGYNEGCHSCTSS